MYSPKKKGYPLALLGKIFYDLDLSSLSPTKSPEVDKSLPTKGQPDLLGFQ